MSKNLYVGNLAFGCTADDLRELFSQHGNVSSAQVFRIGKPVGHAGSASWKWAMAEKPPFPH